MSSATTSDPILAEWKEARNIISAMDKTISGLRKYGFSFVTGLLTADSVLGQPTAQSAVVLSPAVKLAAIASTLVLICALYSTERFYKIVQTGAAAAASHAEEHLKFELTTLISKVYQEQGARYLIEVIYGLFAAATAILGALILYPDLLLVGIVLLASGGAVTFIATVEWSAQRAERPAVQILRTSIDRLA